MEGVELQPVRRVDEAGDQQDRADGHEDVLAEEDPDRVGARREALDLLPYGLGGPRAVTALGGALGHRVDERADHLRGSADRPQADRGGDLPDQLVQDEEASGGQGAEPGDQTAGLFLQAVAFDQADDRKDEDEQGDRGAPAGAAAGGGGERLAAKPLPKALRIAIGESLPRKPVTMPATVTTTSGLSRSANPMTTSRTP